jgi:enolase-phosphatase E1
MKTRSIVTDIEGTTSSIAFVHDVLFPYASKMLPEFVRRHARDKNVAELLNTARQEAGENSADVERVIAILLQWIREDRKATPLKALQGLIWEQGYAQKDFTGHIYEDAARNLRIWHKSGIELYVYSSGSVQAQQLLFGHSDAGDLRPLFKGYFDTRIGGKREADSYRAIIDTIGAPADTILFLSDIVAELDAARDAGMQTLQLVRDPGTQTDSHLVAHSFDDIQL